MAIEKVKGTPKVEWTVATLIHLGVSVILVVLSGVLGWMGFVNWRFKSSLVEGYQEYDRGRPTAAKNSLEAALGWRPKHVGARELLAKILCDDGKLEDARKQYNILKAQGHSSPQVNVGLGVIALKEVEALDKPGAIQALVSEAAASFKAAGNVPEAEIGLGHCDLVIGRKLQNPAYFQRAQQTFAKVKASMDSQAPYRAMITRDGLIDYYTGVGKALSASEKFDEGARDAFRACFQYTPGWSLPLANVLALEARRFATFTETNEVLVKLQPDITALRNQAGANWKTLRNKDEREAVREQWMQFSLALAQAWGRAGNVNEMSAITRDLGSSPGFEQRMEPYLLDSSIRTELAVRDDPNPAQQESNVTKATTAYNELLQKLPADDANRERRAKAFNNAAWTLAWRGGYLANEGLYSQAVQRLTEALRLMPDDYVYNRNMAIILKRFKKPPSAPSAFLEKARAAAAKEKEWAEDFDKLQKYIEAK